MQRHARYPVAVHVFLLRDDSVLLLRRSNTGFEDGRLSVVAGHVEPGESVTAAAIRETHEEVGIGLAASRLRAVGVMHRRSSEGRIDFFFASEIAGEQPRNAEPGKCSEILWAPIADPPSDTIPYVRAALANYREGRWFDTFGWCEDDS